MQGWSEREVRATVKAYFKMLDIQSGGKETNKAEVYRKLAKEIPARSVKAIERKFQNISAVLYEEKLPYCDGLKPFFNYQGLLRLAVLERVNRLSLPAQEPHKILYEKLGGLAERGFLPVTAKGSGRFGLSMEHYLGIPPNSDKGADFMGIELKTKVDNSLQTLFSRVPTRYLGALDKKVLVRKYGYQDQKRARLALYTSFSSFPDSLGFRLKATRDKFVVVRKDVPILEYDFETIEAALLSKHSQTVFLNLSVRKNKGRENCKLESGLFCKWPSIIKFINLVRNGCVFLDFTLSMKGNGRVRDHGFLWRLRKESIRDLYLSVENWTWE